MRFDDDVFHFQFLHGRLILSRDRWGEFQLAYRGYQNRNIHSTLIDVSPETFARLHRAFVGRYVTQQQQLERLADAEADLALLTALRQQPPAPVELPGFGFFAVEHSAVRRGPAQAPLRSLREDVVERHGAGLLTQRRADAAAALRELPVQALSSSAQDFAPGALPSPQYAFSVRYGDLAAAQLALAVLDGEATLSDGALSLAPFSPPEFALSGADRDGLVLAAAGLRQRLVELAASPRPDWGQAMLLGMARLSALRAALDQGRWVFINTLGDDAASVTVGPQTRQVLPLLEADARQRWQAELARWRTQQTWREGYYANLEDAAVSWQELRRVAATGERRWRLRDSEALPRGMGPLDDPPLPVAVQRDGPQLAAAMIRADRHARELAERTLSYSLLRRNCVSELFATVDLAMTEAAREHGDDGLDSSRLESLRREYARRLGLRFEPSPIPFASSDQVRRYWRVRRVDELQSLRRIYVAQQRGGERWAALREATTLSSSVYRRSDRDSYFVFFTDGRSATRPLLGLANLTAALGMSVVGAVQAPFDRGHNLKAGLKGALFSLPELGFQNIRKGTSTWLPTELRELKLAPAP